MELNTPYLGHMKYPLRHIEITIINTAQIFCRKNIVKV